MVLQSNSRNRARAIFGHGFARLWHRNNSDQDETEQAERVAHLAPDNSKTFIEEVVECTRSHGPARTTL